MSRKRKNKSLEILKAILFAIITMLIVLGITVLAIAILKAIGLF